MKTNHEDSVKYVEDRPKNLPRITPENLCKAKYADENRLCYTGWLLEIFLRDECPYPQAYKQFRCKTMDVLYSKYSEDHASSAEQRAEVFNQVAEELGYYQIDSKRWLQENKTCLLKLD